MSDEEYSIVPDQEIKKLKEEISAIKRNPLSSSPSGQDLQSSVNSLNKTLSDLVSLFQTTSQSIKEEDMQPKAAPDQLKPVMEKHEWGDEVRLLMARMVKPENLESMQRREKQYMRFVEKRRELMAKGEPIPLDLRDQIEVEEDDAEEEEDDDGDTSIEISDAP